MSTRYCKQMYVTYFLGSMSKVFTKQPAEAENDAAPSECNKGKVANSVDNMPDIQPRINEVPLDCQKSTTDITSEVSSTSPSKATPKTKVVRFHRDLVTGKLN